MFLSALPRIEQTVRFVAHRHRLSTAEADDFASEVKLAFIEQDYAVLDRFQGRSSLPTYLVTVIQRLYIDHLRKRYGRWRPSIQARRLGALAVRLEALLYRDGMSFTEACEALRTNDGVTESEVALSEIAKKLSRRGRPGPKPAAADQHSEPLLAHSSEPDNRLLREETAERCQRGLEAALRDLPAEDRFLIRLRFEDGVSVADIARGLGFEQKALYRRLERLLTGLRNVLVQHQLSWPDVKQLIDDGACHVRLPPVSSAETDPASPSQSEARS